MSKLFRLVVLAIVLVSTVVATHRSSAGESPNSLLVFERLSSLVGEWRGLEGVSGVKLIYTLTADGSALMEDSYGPKNAMVTLFTVDGDHLIATHCCSVGNQPQMITGPITDPYAKTIVFSLSRVTGMKAADDWHNTGLSVTIEDKEHLTQIWTYEEKGQKGCNTFHFVRTK